jgi:hypothetical protein
MLGHRDYTYIYLGPMGLRNMSLSELIIDVYGLELDTRDTNIVVSLLIKKNHENQCLTRRVSPREQPSPTISTKDLKRILKTLAKEYITNKDKI